MANVYLTAGELKGKRPLPVCCIVCGASRAKLTETRLALHAANRWSFGGGSVSVMRYLTTSLPLCKAHKTYFTAKQWLALYLFGGVFALFILLMFCSGVAILALGSNAAFVIVPAILLAVASLFGLIAYFAFLSKSGVHPRKMTRDGMEMANVSDQFVDALEALRAEADDDLDNTVFKEFSDD